MYSEDCLCGELMQDSVYRLFNIYEGIFLNSPCKCAEELCGNDAYRADVMFIEINTPI